MRFLYLPLTDEVSALDGSSDGYAVGLPRILWWFFVTRVMTTHITDDQFREAINKKKVCNWKMFWYFVKHIQWLDFIIIQNVGLKVFNIVTCGKYLIFNNALMKLFIKLYFQYLVCIIFICIQFICKDFSNFQQNLLPLTNSEGKNQI